MQHLDTRVIDRALDWLAEGRPLWLCTVLATYGSSPRGPGSLLAADDDGQAIGSLSGGCVEEDFLERLGRGELRGPVTTLRYGDGGITAPRLRLPCDGVLEILVERIVPTPADREHLRGVRRALNGEAPLCREVSLFSGASRLVADDQAAERVTRHQRDGDSRVRLRITPSIRLVIAGISPVSEYCADFARALGFEVIVCDPRPEACRAFPVAGVRVVERLPSRYLAEQGAHGATAVVALTHDPRIDDLAMIEAVRTQAFYLGVMGSARTSQKRAERLARAGGLGADEIARIHMPIGVDIGSKTPAQIALAILADLLARYHGKTLSVAPTPEAPRLTAVG